MKLPLISDTETARIAQIVPATEAEGPGLRFAIWFQGCPLRCPGCCNPEFLPFTGGTATSTAEVIKTLQAQKRLSPTLEGVSLIGGEPFAHAAAGVVIAEAAHSLGLSVMIYTGYVLEELRAKSDAAIDRLLELTDVLVDGPYRREEPDAARRWIGSTNQRVHFLTDRHDAAEPCWRQRNTLEVRVVGSEITVNGFPAAGAVGLWKGWTRKSRLHAPELTPRPRRHDPE